MTTQGSLKSNWIFTAKNLDKSRLNKLLSKFFDNKDNLKTNYFQFAIIGMSAMTPENTTVEGYVQLKEGFRWSSGALQKHLDVSVEAFNSDDIVFGQEEAKKMNPDSIVQNIEKRSRKVKTGGEIRKKGRKLECGNNGMSEKNQTRNKPKKRELYDDDSSCSSLPSTNNKRPGKKSKPKELYNDEKRTRHKKQKSEKKRRRESSAKERNSHVPKSGRRNCSSQSDEQPRQAAPSNAAQIQNSFARPRNTTCEMAEIMVEVRSEIRRMEEARMEELMEERMKACMAEFMEERMKARMAEFTEELRSDIRSMNAEMAGMASLFKSLFGSVRAIEAK